MVQYLMLSSETSDYHLGQMRLVSSGQWIVHEIEGWRRMEEERE